MARGRAVDWEDGAWPFMRPGEGGHAEGNCPSVGTCTSTGLSISVCCCFVPPPSGHRDADMHSPLPGSSALEAGILEDPRPPRLSRVQDNVRNLLRRSVASTIRSSIIRPPPPRQATVEDEPRSPWQSPRNRNSRTTRQPGVLPSPVSTTTSSAATATDSSVDPDPAEAAVLFPPTTYQQQVQEMAHQSTMFNTRALAALRHPDLSDPSLADYLQQKTDDRQRRAWKRSRSRKLRQRKADRSTAAWIVMIFSGLLLAGLIATCELLSLRLLMCPVLIETRFDSGDVA